MSPYSVRLRSDEFTWLRRRFLTVDAEVVMALRKLSDGSHAPTIYTRIEGVVYESTDAVTVDEGQEEFDLRVNELQVLDRALRGQETDFALVDGR